MDELGFSMYLLRNNFNKKVGSDIISRIKRIERSIKNCDIDEEYDKDQCTSLLLLFNHMGENEQIKKVLIHSFPIGSYAMNTFKYAIRKYVLFKKEELKL